MTLNVLLKIESLSCMSLTKFAVITGCFYSSATQTISGLIGWYRAEPAEHGREWYIQ